jgi:hypothetical protein
MRCCLSTPGSPEYILRVAHSASVTPVSPNAHHRFLTIYLVAAIELLWRCIWTPRSSELRDGLGGRDRLSLEIDWEAMIEGISRCTWRLRLSELRDTLGDCDRASWGCNWRSRLGEIRDALGGNDQVSVEMHLAAEVD